jgi:hypothetical protein
LIFTTLFCIYRRVRPALGGKILENLSKVDHNALRTNQALIIGLLLAAFVFNAPVLVLLVMAVMLVGSAVGRPGFLPVYRAVLLRLGWVRPDPVADHPEPHRFAQTLGGSVLFGAGLALLLGASGLGWGLTWFVIFLAALNLFGGFCAGCFVYYWLSRLGVPGFSQSPPSNTFPGMRPKAR